MADLTPQSETPTPTTDKITQAARETIYLCNFRVSVDGEWLCLRELNDISLTPDPEPAHEGTGRPLGAGPGPAGCGAGSAGFIRSEILPNVALMLSITEADQESILVNSRSKRDPKSFYLTSEEFV